MKNTKSGAIGLLVCIVVLQIFVVSCKGDLEKSCRTKSFIVTATAYNSLEDQTNANPNITAFGDTLKPGLRCIAVSRDLLDSGLVHNTKVKVEGFDGMFTVNDKLNKRWRKRIDIYMGLDLKEAKEWGKKKVRIEYCVPEREAVD